MNVDSNSPTIQKRDVLKRPYAKPQVLNYGTIHEITQALGKAGNADSVMANGNNKTR